jgi:hypothetical protein
MTRRRRPTAQDLHKRLDVLGASIGSSLTVAERTELEQLQREYDEEFGAPIDEWPDDRLDAFFQHVCGYGGKAERMHHLRMRARTPQEVERDRIHGERIKAMSDTELDESLNRLLSTSSTRRNLSARQRRTSS